MKILIHNYGGYPYSRQLAESLAARGHQVEYIYSHTTQLIHRLTPHPPKDNLRVLPIILTQPFNKHAWLARREVEVMYGRQVAKELRRFQPDVVFSADTPLDAQQQVLQACRRHSAKFVFWLQDAIGLATRHILRRRLGLAGELVGRYYEWLERSLARHSDMLIVISADFLPLMQQWNIPPERLRLIPNWAPLSELRLRDKSNPWAERLGLADKFCFLYAGILGFKHNPELFVSLAREFMDCEDVRVVVIAEGQAAEWLKRQQEQESLSNLLLLPYQPAQELAQVLGAGDVLLTVLTSQAGSYSVPSKVLSYLCAGRAQLLSIAPGNLAARLVSENDAGLVSRPEDLPGWLAHARSLYTDQALREKMGHNARQYAENHFDIEKITDQFEEILHACGC